VIKFQWAFNEDFTFIPNVGLIQKRAAKELLLSLIQARQFPTKIFLSSVKLCRSDKLMKILQIGMTQ
jgi:hypothetical protein